jgi:hypothetical protein
LNTFDEFLAIAGQLESSGSRYALIGGVALAFHSLPRFTQDVDLLVEVDDMEKVSRVLVNAGYFESAKPWRFQNANLELHRFMKTQGEDSMMIDVLLAEDEAHRGIIRDAVELESAKGLVRVARKEDLIALKRIRNSRQDQLDIEGLEHE